MVNNNKTPRTRKINTIENKIEKIISELDALRRREGVIRIEMERINKELKRIEKKRIELEKEKEYLQTVDKNIIYPGRRRRRVGAPKKLFN